MADTLPALVLTGASGFIGRAFLEAARERYRIYAIARRGQHEARVPKHPNIEWIQIDIGHSESVERVAAWIAQRGGADYVLHLAAHYDFDNREAPEYLHTNVRGTRHVLELARRLEVNRFLFASSVAACPLPEPGRAIDEATPPDADFPYARSKKAGELMIQEYSGLFPCSIVRLAAVFSDYCEYAPLYVFLSTWLSHRWNARILGGRGRAAVPYIHVRDVNRLFLRLLEQDGLPGVGVYLASPDGATSHRDLFELATRFRFGRVRKPLFMPKPLAGVGVLLRDLLGRVTGRRPFERPWMVHYIDRPLVVDATRTREILAWAPTPRLQLTRRILFLIEKMKSDPLTWSLLNESAMKRSEQRPALAIHDAMMEVEDLVTDSLTAYLLAPERRNRFPNYALMGHDELRWYVCVACGLLRAAVRTADRTLLLQYVHRLARRRYEAGFPASEVCDALLVISEITLEHLSSGGAIDGFEEEARDAITLTIALAIDGVQDAYEVLAERLDPVRDAAPSAHADGRSLAEIVEQLNAFYRPRPEPCVETAALDR